MNMAGLFGVTSKGFALVFWFASTFLIPNLALIWFPEVISDLSCMFHGGRRKDAIKRFYTPPWILVFFGWFFLLALPAFRIWWEPLQREPDEGEEGQWQGLTQERLKPRNYQYAQAEKPNRAIDLLPYRGRVLLPKRYLVMIRQEYQNDELQEVSNDQDARGSDDEFPG
jgi:hypothetical protein